MALGSFFSSDIMWWLGDWDTTDPAPAPVASKEPEKGKIILVSTSWWEVANHIGSG